MRYQKLWQTLALISLLALLAVVFTAMQPGSDSLRPRQMRLPNGEAVVVKPGQSDGPVITGSIISEPVYRLCATSMCGNCRRSGQRSKIACCPSTKCRAARQPNAPAIPGRLTIRWRRNLLGRRRCLPRCKTLPVWIMQTGVRAAARHQRRCGAGVLHSNSQYLHWHLHQNHRHTGSRLHV